MGRLRQLLRRLEKSAEGEADSFELADGTRFWYDPTAVFAAVFAHGSESLRADFKGEDRPPPPEILQALTRAKDRESAVRKLYPKGSYPLMAYSVDALIERGVLEHRSFLAGYDDYAESRQYLASKRDLSRGGTT